jgi:hypothetical protein
MRSPVCRWFLVLGMYALVAFAQEEKRATSLPISQANRPLPSSQTPASAAKCAELVKLSLRDVTITSATNTLAGTVHSSKLLERSGNTCILPCGCGCDAHIRFNHQS